MKFKRAFQIIGLLLITCGCSQQSDSPGLATMIAQGIQQTTTAIYRSTSQSSDNENEPLQMTSTPAPLKPTPTLTPSPSPIFDSNPKGGGDAVFGIYYFPVVSLLNVSVKKNLTQGDAPKGETYIIVDITMENDQTEVVDLGSRDFWVVDSNGVAQESTYIGLDCELDYSMTVFPGGILRGCIAFLIPDTGQAKLIYAPHGFERFGSDFFLSWKISYTPVGDSHKINSFVPTEISQSNRDFEVIGLFLNSGEIFAKLRNTTNQVFKNVFVEYLIYDEEGNVVKSEKQGLAMELVFPGEVVPFHSYVDFSRKDNNRFGLVAYGEVADNDYINTFYKDLKVIEFDLGETDDVWLPMIGKVKNVGNKVTIWVNILVIAVDENGEIIGFGGGLAGFDDGSLGPGDEQSITNGNIQILHPDGKNAVDHYEFFLESVVGE